VIGNGASFSSSLSDGAHAITASVTDSDGGVGSAGISVTVAAPAISLSANGYKVQGKQNVDLSWSGATGTVVDIYRDGALVVNNTANDGAHTDAIGAKGGGTYEYQLCEEAPLTSCSPIVTVVF
jgi:hypothetical protein